MNRYIDADTLYVKVKAECNPYGKPTISFDDGCKVLDMIRRTSTADVAPVVHSYWIEDGDDYICANCNEIVFPCVSGLQMDKSLKEGKTYWNYCPHCGAIMDMDGRDNDRWQRPEELGVKECPVCGEEGNDE